MDDYQRWDLPAQGWSRADFRDDNIKIIRKGDAWWGEVERDQCVHRDLDAEEIASVRREFGITARNHTR